MFFFFRHIFHGKISTTFPWKTMPFRSFSKKKNVLLFNISVKKRCYLGTLPGQAVLVWLVFHEKLNLSARNPQKNFAFINFLAIFAWKSWIFSNFSMKNCTEYFCGKLCHSIFFFQGKLRIFYGNLCCSANFSWKNMSIRKFPIKKS